MPEEKVILRLGRFGTTAVVLVALAIAVSFFSPLPTDKVEFNKLVASWMVPEISVTSAKGALERNGFKVGRQTLPKQWKDQRDYLFATRGKYVFPIFNREWRVICRIEQERIVDVETMIFLHAPWVVYLPAGSGISALNSIHWQRRPIHHPPKHNARMHAGHAIDARDVVEQQFLIRIHILDDNSL
jgi:hypothetical protein